MFQCLAVHILVRRASAAVLGLFLLCCCGSIAQAGRMLHHIEFTLPRCGQAGTTVEVTMQGSHISSPRDVVFFRPGIKVIDVEQLPDLKYPEARAHGGVAEQQVRCKFVIAPDCPLGEHPFRLMTATEMSTVSTFWVTPSPMVNEGDGGQGKNDTPATALSVPNESTVQGRIENGRQGDVDVYRIFGKTGQHLSVEIVSVWLTELFYAESEFDLMVRILDSNGVELASNDDNALHVQDPIASVVLPRDGDYFVEVQQRLYKGGSHIYYIAQIGTNRRPLAAYPAGGQAGQPLTTTLLGDPQGPYQATIDLPASTGKFDYYEQTPSPVPMRVSSYPNVLEDPQAAETNVEQLPKALNGIIEKPGDTDAFRVHVKKGENYRVRVYARSLGTPLDPKFSLRHVDDQSPELEGDDANHEERELFGVSSQVYLKDLLDPSKLWSPKKDGDYIFQMGDMRNLGDPTFVYRVELEPVHDGVHTYLSAPVIDRAECPRLTNIVVPQGNQWTLNFLLAPIQGNTYKGELAIVATGLPPGVRMIAPRVHPGQKSVPVQFIAEPGAKPQCTTIQVTAQPVDPAIDWETGSHQSAQFLSHSGGRAWHEVSMNCYAIAVTDPAPYHIEVIPPGIPLAQSGELAIQVNVKRLPEFNEPIDVQFDWAPDGVQSQPTITIPAEESSAILRLSASPSAKAGTWPMAVTSSTTSAGDYYLGVGRIRTSSSFFDVEIGEQYLALKNQPTAVRRGEKAEVVWEVEHKKDFPGEAEAVLLGLPKGVTVVGGNPRLKSKDQKLIFLVTATNDALMGQYKELSCEIIVQQGGQIIRQRTGKGVLRVDPALAAPTAGTTR